MHIVVHELISVYPMSMACGSSHDIDATVEIPLPWGREQTGRYRKYSRTQPSSAVEKGAKPKTLYHFLVVKALLQPAQKYYANNMRPVLLSNIAPTMHFA